MNVEWLDTETRALLCEGCDKSTLTATSAFSLLLLSKGPDVERRNSVVNALAKHGTANTTRFPFVVRQGLSLDEALAGQFALACCDCSSAFVLDEVVAECDAADFAELFSQLSSSPEFAAAVVEIVSVPSHDKGRNFLWQFLGFSVGIVLPLKVRMMRKKARLMVQCARSIGAVVRVDR